MLRKFIVEHALQPKHAHRYHPVFATAVYHRYHRYFAGLGPTPVSPVFRRTRSDTGISGISPAYTCLPSKYQLEVFKCAVFKFYVWRRVFQFEVHPAPACYAGSAERGADRERIHRHKKG